MRLHVSDWTAQLFAIYCHITLWKKWSQVLFYIFAQQASFHFFSFFFAEALCDGTPAVFSHSAVADMKA